MIVSAWIRIASAAVFVCVAEGAVADAFEIQNRDATGYEVRTQCRGIHTTTKVSPRGGCINCGRSGPYPCTVTVVETGSATTVGGPTKIVIKDGKPDAK